MTYEEKKKLIEAMLTIQKHCRNNRATHDSRCECVLKNDDRRECEFWRTNLPDAWKIPTITRWTPEDVALAKALKAVGAHGFYKNKVKGDVFWIDGKGNSAKLPKGCLKALENGTEISIDTIIKEAEE